MEQTLVNGQSFQGESSIVSDTLAARFQLEITF